MATTKHSQIDSVSVNCAGTWKIEANDTWMKIGNGSSYSSTGSTAWDSAGQSLSNITGKATIYVLVAPNETGAARTGTLKATVTSNSSGVAEQSASCTVKQSA